MQASIFLEQKIYMMSETNEDPIFDKQVFLGWHPPIDMFITTNLSVVIETVAVVFHRMNDW